MARDQQAQRLINLAFTRLKRVGGDPADLPDPERTIVRVVAAQGVIGNGGFQYFFEMDWAHRPPYAVISDAYRTIGARRAAEKIDRAVALFPFDRPHLSAKRRNKYMDALPESHRLFKLGDAVCVDKTVEAKLYTYAVRHANVLAVPLSRRNARAPARR